MIARARARFGATGVVSSDSIRTRTRASLVALLATSALALTAAPASADRAYDSQLTGFTNPWGLAVDNSDNVWIADVHSGGVVDKFDSSGNLSAQSSGTTWSGNYIQSVAFSNAAGKLFVADSNADDVWGLNPDATYSGTDLKGLATWGGGCCFIFTAADNSGGSTDLYVSSSNGTVTRIDGGGNPVDFTAGSSAGSNVLTGADATAGSFATPESLAVDSSGNLYVVDSGHTVVDEFHPDGSFSRQFTGGFGSVSAVAVDPTNGDVLIADPAQHLVHEFDSSGSFIADVSGADTPAGSLGNPRGLAVNSNGDLYVSDSSNQVVDVFGPSGPPLPKFPLEVERTGSGAGAGTVTSTPGGINCGSTCSHEFSEGKTVTLTATPTERSTFAGWEGCTNVNGEEKCEVEITEAKSVKAKFEEIPQESLTVEKTGPGSGTVIGTAPGLEFPPIDCGSTCEATYNQGATILLTAGSAPHNRFTAWTGCDSEPSATECEVTMSAAKAVEAEFEAIPQETLEVQRTGAGAGEVTSSPTGIECGATCSAPFDEGAVLTLTASPAAHSAFTGWSDCETVSGPGNDECTVTMGESKTLSADFQPLPIPTTGEATDLGKTSATLQGAVDPNGVELTECAFEYGKAEEPYEHTAICVESPAQIGSGEEAKEVHAEISGLQIGAAYHYRLLTVNPDGTAAGGDQSFTTAPAVAGLYTAAATTIRPTSATLNGQLDPAGEDTHYRFEYVSEEAFDSTGFATALATPEEDAGSTSSETFLSAHLSGLTAGTAYRFRLLASNGLGTTAGAAQAFTPGSPLTERTFSSFGAGQLSAPVALAVDGSSSPSGGDVYVADPAAHRVEKFDSSGHFILTFGEGVDQTTGAGVCTAASGDQCGPGAPGSSPGALSSPAFVAVDGSSGPSAGDVYVADTADNLVSKFTPDGALITAWGAGGRLDIANLPSTPPQIGPNPVRPVGSLTGIALDSAGTLFVSDNNLNMFEFGPNAGPIGAFNTGYPSYVGFAVDSADNFYLSPGNVYQVDAAGTEIGQVTGGGGFTPETGLAIDPSNDDLYLDRSGSFIQRYQPNRCNISSQICTSVESFGSGHLSGSRGLAVDSGGDVYVADTGDQRVGFFAPLLAAPSVRAGVTINDTATAATLQAGVVPERAQTSYHFEYLTDRAFQENGYSGAASTADADAGIGADPVPVSARLTGLVPDTIYHYRAVATNEFGTVQGEDRTFATYGVAPAVATGAATSVGQATATLHGQLDPQGSAASYRFEYGTTTNYGTITAEADAGSAEALTEVATSLGALRPATTYHYRLFATSDGGSTAGGDRTFTTQTAPSPTVPPVEEPKPPVKCRKGFVKKHGKCVRKPSHHRKAHHQRAAQANSGGSK